MGEHHVEGRETGNRPDKDPASLAKVSLSTVFKTSGLVGAQFTKLFYILACVGQVSCSATGFTKWLLTIDTFTHPYSWYHSWIQYPTSGYYYIAAPYGYLWYALNIPAVLGFMPWMLYLLAVDTAASFWVLKTRSWLYILPWMLSSQFFLNYDGVDYYVFLFSSLGLVSPIFSSLAILVKLPFGAPLYVWQFIMFSNASAANPINWGRYAWFGAWWTLGIVLYIKRRKPKLLRQGKISID